MDINSVIKKGIVVSQEDSVSRVAAKMFENRCREAIVMDNDNFLGIVTAGDIIKKRINSPEDTKISSLIVKINPLLPGFDINEVINAMLINNYTSIPVSMPLANQKVGVITKMDILDLIKSDSAIKERVASDAMKFPYQVSPDESISTTRAILKDLNISRLPVVNDRDEAEGMVNTLDLLKVSLSAEKPKEISGDKHKEEVSVSSFMRKVIPRFSPDTPLPKVIEQMVKNKSSAIIERDGKLVGLITPNDVLKVLGDRMEGFYLTIRGIDKDFVIKDAIESEITESMRKISKIDPVNYVILNITKHKDGKEKRVKYSIKAKLVTHKSVFFANNFEWDAIKAARGVLQIFEKEVIKKKERGVF